MRFFKGARVAFLAFLCALYVTAQEEKIKAIFLFEDILQSNTTALTTLGFNTLLIFRVGVLETGDLVYYATGAAAEEVDVPVVTNGTYVGGAEMAEKIIAFKTANGSGIDRVELSLVSADPTFENIRDLIAAEGTGPETVLYRGFEALRTAWGLDAFNNDDESVYDVASTVSFAGMLGDMGYQYSISPYTSVDFWAEVKSQLPGLLDRVYLQCYDGGAGNDPGAWQDALDMSVVPLLWVTNDAKPEYGNTAEKAREKFADWLETDTVAGGGYWNDYDIERMNSSYALYANALNEVFG
ncbi:coagulation factor 5/8 type domain-containing protein [Xylariomycetidae sp. FL2044]|nr:coagulation factor 5/8 type domain-containing protein [Xylariomycetidae sp. FL2044]